MFYFVYRYFSSEPHFAGSKRNNDLARYIAEKWQKYGFDDVNMPEYNVLMNSPRKVWESKVEIHRNDRVIFKSKSVEKVCQASLYLYHAPLTHQP